MFVPVLEVLDLLISISSNVGCLAPAAYAMSVGMTGGAA